MHNFFSFISRPATRCDAAPEAPPLTLPPPESAAATPPPPPATTTSEQPDSISSAAASATAFTNPGPYEHATMDSKRLVSLDTYDGFRIDINKQLSPYMAAVHSFWLGTSMIPGKTKTYSFVTQVADDSGILMARIDPSRGSVDGRIHRAILGGAMMAKIQAGISAEGQQDQLLGEVDFGGLTWSGNLKYGSMGGGIMLGCNYFQSVTPNLAMGGEGMYLGSNKALLSSYMLKYGWDAPGEDGRSSVVANLNTGQGLLTVNYMRAVTKDRVTLGAELQSNLMTMESQVLFGAEVKLLRSKINLCVDGTGKIQNVVETKIGISPGAPTLTFSAEMDHATDTMRFGYGLNIGA